MALADFEALLGDLVRDQEGVADAGARGRALEAARLRYSHDAMRELVDDVYWPATGTMAPVPVRWTDGSWIKSAVRLVGGVASGELELAVGRTPDAWELVCLDALMQGTEVRLTYTADHLLDAVNDTVAPLHRLPVAQYAAHLLCHQLATHYSAQRETTIGADVSRSEGRAREFAARAKEYRTAYFVGIGLPDPYARATAGATGGGAGGSGAVAAAAVGSWPGRNRRYFSGWGVP